MRLNLFRHFSLSFAFSCSWGAAGACGLAVVDGGDLVVACAVAVCGVSVIVVGVREGV